MISESLQKVSQVISEAQARKNKEKEIRITIGRVIQKVGGLNEFLELPLPAFFEIVKILQTEDAYEAKKMKAMFGSKGSKRRGN